MSDKLTIYTDHPPSEWMVRAFVDCGSLAGSCACGRVHFEDNPRAGDWEPLELERLRAERKANPDKYHDDGCSIATIGGNSFVVGCPRTWGEVSR